MILSLFVFALAILIGSEIIQKVPQTLHTPLMSGSNAISGITIVGAIALATIQSAGTEAGLPWWARAVALLAIVFAMINVVGGFLVTDRMLRMFRRR
jgi:NAD(P) transhydrogenase subunit alpha